MKKCITGLLSSFLLVSAAQAAYPTSLERVYYKSAAKTEIVGYFTLGCVVNNRVRVGLKTSFYEDEKPAMECNRSSFNTGSCILERTSDLDYSSGTYALEFSSEVRDCLDLRDAFYSH
jgi:hypothetical protein